MKMMKNNPWKSIDGVINSKRCDPESNFNIFWYITADNEYSFVINHLKLEDWPKDKFSFSEIKIEQLQMEFGFQIRIKLLDQNDWDIFYSLCLDLLSVRHSAKDEATLLKMIHSRLKRWQQMFRKVKNNLLSLEEQRGLIGELNFLKNYLLPNFNYTEAMSFWRGPLDEAKDFGIGNTTVEVKSKLGTTSSKISISSLDQLEFKTEQAFLYVITINTSDDSEVSYDLNSLVQEVRKIIQDDLNSLEIYETLLNEIGYRYLDEYSKVKYITLHESFYNVLGNFPKLLKSNIPEAIESVQYSINLNMCTEYNVTIEDFIQRITNE